MKVSHYHYLFDVLMPNRFVLGHISGGDNILQSSICDVDKPLLIVVLEEGRHIICQLRDAESFGAFQDFVLEDTHGRLAEVICVVSMYLEILATSNRPLFFTSVIARQMLLEYPVKS